MARRPRIRHTETETGPRPRLVLISADEKPQSAGGAPLRIVDSQPQSSGGFRLTDR